MSTIKYAIADDHKIFRQGLRHALTDDKQLELVGEADDGVHLLSLMAANLPEVVLMDIKMPGMDGINATQKIRELYPDVKILMLTSYDDEHFVLHLLELGANGYLLKNTEPDEIKKAIRHVSTHDYYFNDLASNTMLRKIMQKNKGLITDIVTLNDREKDVLRLICEEYTTSEIGKKVFLSTRTIEGIRSTLIEKTGVKNTAGLVVYAVKNGILKV